MVDATWKAHGMDDGYHEELAAIAAELAAIVASGQVLPGTIVERTTRCGRQNCACHADPPRKHGPYWHWTRKVAGKTVGRWLKADQAEEYGDWIENDRRIKELLSLVEALGIAAVEADERTASRH
jgi:hypothetical protein